MYQRPLIWTRRSVLAGVSAAFGAAVLPYRPATAEPRSALSLGSVAAAAPEVNLFKQTRVPAAAFRPSNSSVAWSLTPATITSTTTAPFTAPLLPVTGDHLLGLQVHIEPGGQSGAIGFDADSVVDGSTTSLGTATYPPSGGLQAVDVQIANRALDVADPGHGYTVSVELKPGVVLHGAVLTYVPPTTGFVPVAPARIYDSRQSPGTKLDTGNETFFSVPVSLFVPTVLLDLTITQTEGAGYLVVYPSSGEGPSRPATSNINWTAPNQDLANLVVTQVGFENTNLVYAGGSGRTHLIIDLLGYFT
jgi:hypothetical protein